MWRSPVPNIPARNTFLPAQRYIAAGVTAGAVKE